MLPRSNAKKEESLLFENSDRAVAVFSHPNHELAVFGFLQRLRPFLIFLTDGGREGRVAETRKGLESIQLLDRAVFMNYPEKSFYDALLSRSAVFYQSVAGHLRFLLEDFRAQCVFSDAIEFYNPLHDLSLPLVRAALRESPAIKVFEVPIIRQSSGADTYQIQRVANSRRGEQIELPLSQSELEAKIRARDRIYTLLVSQLGVLISDLPVTYLAREVVVPATSSIPKPAHGIVPRYELRAQLLWERSEIEQRITYDRHYLPIATLLWNTQKESRLSGQIPTG